MAILFRHFRPFVAEAPRKSTTSPAQRKNRQHLQVKISKEPPTILYFERVQDEQICECIFDPMVLHDEEKDHPDLFDTKHHGAELKPWQKPPYCNTPPGDHSLIKRLTSMMRMKSSSS